MSMDVLPEPMPMTFTTRHPQLSIARSRKGGRKGEGETHLMFGEDVPVDGRPGREALGGLDGRRRGRDCERHGRHSACAHRAGECERRREASEGRKGRRERCTFGLRGRGVGGGRDELAGAGRAEGRGVYPVGGGAVRVGPTFVRRDGVLDEYGAAVHKG